MKHSIKEMSEYFQTVDYEDMASTILKRNGKPVQGHSVKMILNGYVYPSLISLRGIAAYSGLSLDEVNAYLLHIEENPPPAKRRTSKPRGAIGQTVTPEPKPRKAKKSKPTKPAKKSKPAKAEKKLKFKKKSAPKVSPEERKAVAKKIAKKAAKKAVSKLKNKKKKRASK